MRRGEARKAGLVKYSDGKPCKRGHISERRVNNGNCCACEIEKGKASRKGRIPVFARLDGLRFGRLVVIEREHRTDIVVGTAWRCVCDCGKVHFASSSSLQKGHTKSCGCYAAEVQAKRSENAARRKSTYRLWHGLLRRCLKEGSSSYANYGGRGITVCERWRVFANFYEDMGDKPSPRHSIDRINNDGNYEPENCRWATPDIQCNNTRHNTIVEFSGKRQSISMWSKETGIPSNTIAMRIREYGWPPKKALTTPVKKTARWP